MATWHAMLGSTVGPVTGQLVAAIIHGGTAPDAARPFSAARFELFGHRR